MAASTTAASRVAGETVALMVVKMAAAACAEEKVATAVHSVGVKAAESWAAQTATELTEAAMSAVMGALPVGKEASESQGEKLAEVLQGKDREKMRQGPGKMGRGPGKMERGPGEMERGPGELERGPGETERCAGRRGEDPVATRCWAGWAMACSATRRAAGATQAATEAQLVARSSSATAEAMVVSAAWTLEARSVVVQRSTGLEQQVTSQQATLAPVGV